MPKKYMQNIYLHFMNSYAEAFFDFVTFFLAGDLDIGNPNSLTQEELEVIKAELQDLGWEYQRMSSSGQETYNELCKQFGLPEMED